MTIDTRDFRRALSQYPSGVSIMTTMDEHGAPVGMTASSFNSVSLDPPLILWSVEKTGLSAPIFQHAPYFVVNVLRSDQVDMSNRFASRGEDKFANTTYRSGIGNCPVLENTALTLECSTWQVYEGGDHFIIVGQVEHYQYHEEAPALVFHKGRYAVSEAHPAHASNARIEKGFIGNYLLYLLRNAHNNYSSQFYPKLSSLGITIQEWRILSILADESSMSLRALMPLVSQPMKELRETATWLVEKDYASLQDEQLQLTASGQDIALKLLNLAQEHEADVISKMGLNDGAKALKGMLQKLAGVFRLKE